MVKICLCYKIDFEFYIYSISTYSNKSTPKNTYSPTFPTFPTFQLSQIMSIAALIAQFKDADGKLTIPQDKLLEAIATMESQQAEPIEEKPKKRKTKKAKDPNAPKRPTTAYFRWVGENRSRIKEELGDGHKVTDVSKEAGRQWKLVSETEKEPFEMAFKEDQERYKAEMAEYKPAPMADLYDAEDFPTAPEGWTGPYEHKYLWKHAGPDGKAMRFKDFEEAIKAAMTIDECCGITKTSRWYELRRGPDLISVPTGKESSGLASWIKGEPLEAVIMAPKEQEVAEVEEVEEVEEEPKEEKKPKAKKSIVKKVTIVEPEPEPEPEEEEDAGLEVDEITIDGKDYLKSDDGTLYDPETSEEIGKLVDGKVVMA